MSDCLPVSYCCFCASTANNCVSASVFASVTTQQTSLTADTAAPLHFDGINTFLRCVLLMLLLPLPFFFSTKLPFIVQWWTPLCELNTTAAVFCELPVVLLTTVFACTSETKCEKQSTAPTATHCCSCLFRLVIITLSSAVHHLPLLVWPPPSLSSSGRHNTGWLVSELVRTDTLRPLACLNCPNLMQN